MFLASRGTYFAIPLTIGTAITLLAAGLTASGMNWLLRGHPSMEGRSTRRHWLLPTLTTLVTGITLTVLPTFSAWGIGFAVTAVIMLMVFAAEYVVVEPGVLARAESEHLSEDPAVHDHAAHQRDQHHQRRQPDDPVAQVQPLEVQVVMHMDGWGEPILKYSTYKLYIHKEPVQFTGFKLFYKNDLKKAPHRMLTPQDLIKLKPQPIYIQYQ